VRRQGSRNRSLSRSLTESAGRHLHSCARTVSGEGWHAHAELIPGDAVSHPTAGPDNERSPFACIRAHAVGQP
jgi:hypothetical protein